MDTLRDDLAPAPSPGIGSRAEPAILPWRPDVGRTRRTVMPRQIITTANAPSSPLYSQGVKAGPHVFVSGIVGIDPSTGKLAGDTIQDQTRQALTNCQAILEAGGAGLDDVTEVGILLTHPGD